MRGRHSAAILRMMGVTDTIAETIDDYVAIAARLANDPAERQALSARMQGQPAQGLSRPRLHHRAGGFPRAAPCAPASARRAHLRDLKPGKICRPAAERTRRGGPCRAAVRYKLLNITNIFDGTGIAMICPRDLSARPVWGDVRPDSGDEVMGLFDALTAAVSGLQAQAFAHAEHIRQHREFADDRLQRHQHQFRGSDSRRRRWPRSKSPAASSRARSQRTPCKARSRTRRSGTYMAINGDGYFVVQAPSELYRQYARSSAASTATPAAATSSRMRKAIWSTAPAIISKEFRSILRPAIRPATSPLPCNSRITSCRPIRRPRLPMGSTFRQRRRQQRSIPRSQLRTAQSGGFQRRTRRSPEPGRSLETDVSTFLDESVDGGAVTVYDATGTPANLQLRWAKTDSVANGGVDTWNLFYEDGRKCDRHERGVAECRHRFHI